MKWLFKYSLKGISYLFFGYLLIISVMKMTIYRGQDLPILLSFFTYTFFGFWAGMFFMHFLYQSVRRNTDRLN